jgi:ABC-type Fe3+ transport system permease subunit
LLTVLPAIALAIAVLVDCGADGEPRVSLFPIALLAFDPFAWTCARNSLIFATVLTGLSLIGGLGIGWAISARPSRSRGVLRAAVSSMLAAPPACLAIGLLGIWYTPGRWAWPASLREAAAGGLSLESWSGWPKWLLWIWTSGPAAVALVAIATAAVWERIEPAWRDAARLAGAGPIQMWRRVTWPLIRPAAARAAAIVFPLALFEPGVPMILGLRRTLAFQIVEAASRPVPFPRTAVWTAMAAVFWLAGHWLLRSWGGLPLLDAAEKGHHGERTPTMARSAGRTLSIVSSLLAIVTVALGWLPVLGLIRILTGTGTAAGGPTGSTAWSLAEVIQRAMEPPVSQVMVKSLTLGIQVGVGVLLLAWLLRPGPGRRLAPRLGSRLVGRFALMPPLVQGVGVLATLGLSTQAVRSWSGLPELTRPLARIGDLAPQLAVERNPWPILCAAVGLSVGSRLLQSWKREAERRPEESRSGLDAALLAGASLTRSRAVAASRPARWIGALILATALASVNLTPALLFSPWMDGRTAAPALIILSDGRDGDRFQAAALAFCVIASHLAGLCAARFAPGPPPEWHPEPP